MRTFTQALLIYSLTILSAPLSGYAAELAGITLPDSVTVEDSKLQLNGLGLREATIFNVEVYVAGLYLQEKNSSAEAILADPNPKQLTMRFVRDVEKTKITSAWDEGFKNNGANLASLKNQISTFNASMSDMKEGDSMILIFSNNSVEVDIRGEKKGRIEGADFTKAVLAIWLGKAPPNESLKEGLLGSRS